MGKCEISRKGGSRRELSFFRQLQACATDCIFPCKLVREVASEQKQFNTRARSSSDSSQPEGLLLISAGVGLGSQQGTLHRSGRRWFRRNHSPPSTPGHAEQFSLHVNVTAPRIPNRVIRVSNQCFLKVFFTGGGVIIPQCQKCEQHGSLFPLGKKKLHCSLKSTLEIIMSSTQLFLRNFLTHFSTK